MRRLVQLVRRAACHAGGRSTAIESADRRQINSQRFHCGAYRTRRAGRSSSTFGGCTRYQMTAEAISGPASLERSNLSNKGDPLSLQNADPSAKAILPKEEHQMLYHVVDVGKTLTVFQRKAGKWMIIRDTWNSDTATAAPTATSASADPPK
jgi:hypothetical protein